MCIRDRFIGGLMKHARGLSAITNPLVNSYKRLFPAQTGAGFTAPAYISWSPINRSQMIRIPAQREENTRIELRSPDPSCNPYLTLAVCLADVYKRQFQCRDYSIVYHLYPGGTGFQGRSISWKCVWGFAP